LSAQTPFPDFRERVRAVNAAALPGALARLRWSRAELERHQRERLRGLLTRAAQRSSFYAQRLRGVDAEGFELADLARLPTTSKAELMERLDDVFTDPRLSRAHVEEALAATRHEPVPLFGEYIAQATGGSSGRRGVFVSDVETYVEVSSAVIRPTIARLASGSLPPRSGSLTIAVVAAASPVHSTGLAPTLNPRGAGPVAAIGVPVTLPLEEIVARLNALAPHLVLGYPTVLARLARERVAGRLEIAPSLVQSTSETLTPELRAAIRSGFGAPLVDAFGSTEGLMGVSAPDDPVFVFNSDTCLVELVDAHNRPVLPGAASTRVLLTNLANHVQPLIRYEIEDRFTREPDAAEHGHLRASVVGRVAEPLRWGALEVHPLVLSATLLKWPAVLDYQVRQTSNGVAVDVLVERPTELGPLAASLRAALAAAGLRDPQVSVSGVARLARRADSGKLQRFVPLGAEAPPERAT
jgi:phenylacetate-coenzyme A ligase PaaK-like adenylate-forming protein